MSTPGSGPQPPEQNPGQPGQGAGRGQQPPTGQPVPGQPWDAPQGAAGQQPWGAPQPDQPGQQPWGAPPAGQQPWGATGAQAYGQPEQPAKKSRTWLPIVGGVLVLLVVLALLSTFLGGGDPEVGDCVTPDGNSFATVDCDSDDAQEEIVGTDDDLTGEEFYASDPNELCLDYPTATSVLWWGSEQDEDGKVYCSAAL